jgi:hypothetical protein
VVAPAEARPAARQGPRGPGRLERWGLALAAPRWALAVADDPRHPGRAGSDLLGLLGLSLLAVHLRGLVAAIWIGLVFGLGAGGHAVLMVLSGAFTADLAFLVIGALVVWLAGGPRRALGRAFDQACVAVVPLVAVQVAATAVVHALDVRVPAPVGLGLVAVGYAWSGSILALALVQMRRTPRPVEAS